VKAEPWLNEQIAVAWKPVLPSADAVLKRDVDARVLSQAFMNRTAGERSGAESAMMPKSCFVPGRSFRQICVKAGSADVLARFFRSCICMFSDCHQQAGPLYEGCRSGDGAPWRADLPTHLLLL
jgi:hypothetical protein